MTVPNRPSCTRLPFSDRGCFGWLCGECWIVVCRILKREP